MRLISTHPAMRVAAMTADRKAGASMTEVFPHLRHLDLPRLARIEDVDLSAIDMVFCALPHATTQQVVVGLDRAVRDLRAAIDRGAARRAQ